MQSLPRLSSLILPKTFPIWPLWHERTSVNCPSLCQFLSLAQSIPCHRHSRGSNLGLRSLWISRTGWTAAALDCPATDARLASSFFLQVRQDLLDDYRVTSTARASKLETTTTSRLISRRQLYQNFLLALFLFYFRWVISSRTQSNERSERVACILALESSPNSIISSYSLIRVSD